VSDNTNAPLLPASQNARQVMWQTPVQKPSEAKTIVYQSEAMNQLIKMVERVAPSQANVLILGESGTGKELIARAVHDKSNRRTRPFIAINCGALREALLESELFGHEKGSFTGAYTKKLGLAEAANGGTLFLDEIGELAPGVQAKLLRFLQEGEIYRVGGKDPIQVDVRVICATNRDLEKEVAQGNFREDLFYRINTIAVSVPPLRRRKEDIPVLINHFLTVGGYQNLNRGRSMDVEALKLMQAYEWPGNIRELQNVCERMQILSEGHQIMAGDVPDHVRTPEEKDSSGEYDPAMTLSELEKRFIIKALNYFDGNKTQAAGALGITIKTLYNKLHEYGEFDKYEIHTRPTKEG
jgi:DNA-binding NtrC family response regulator